MGLLLTVTACGDAEDVRPAASDEGVAASSGLRAPLTTDDSVHTRAALDALVAWLDASLERSDAAPAYLASLCDDPSSFPSPLLATYDLMEARMRGDTVVARASVTTVAEQDVDRRVPNGFVARQRVRTDVLEWDVIPTDDGWQVCNGIRFGYRGADSLTRWLPEGASILTARMLADSVRTVAGAVPRDGGS